MPRKYDEEFKKKTVEYVMSHPNHSIRKSAEKLKISPSSLQNWVTEYKDVLVKDAIKTVNKSSKKIFIAKQKPNRKESTRKSVASALSLARANVENLTNMSEDTGNNETRNLEWENLRLKEENKRLKKVIRSLALED